jgi:hypothetical protein
MKNLLLEIKQSFKDNLGIFDLTGSWSREGSGMTLFEEFQNRYDEFLNIGEKENLLEILG